LAHDDGFDGEDDDVGVGGGVLCVGGAGDAEVFDEESLAVGVGVGGEDVGALVEGGAEDAAGDGLGHVACADESDGGHEGSPRGERPLF
jgi:hypothetical protein